MDKKVSPIGSSFDDFLREEGIYEECRARAFKRILAMEIEEAMIEQNISKSEMARRMNSSRSAVDRLLDQSNPSVTLMTLFKAAGAVGRDISVKLV